MAIISEIYNKQKKTRFNLEKLKLHTRKVMQTTHSPNASHFWKGCMKTT